VSDTGIGMDAEVRERIFEPFFTTKPSAIGSGLGLSSVYGIVKQSGGDITVDSEVGLGTTFRIYLPQDVEAPKPAVSEAQRPVIATGGQTILVVEDEPGVRALAAATLGMRGYQVLQASTGEEALALVTGLDRPIHLLLTDLVMPGMSGQQLATLLAGIQPDLRIMYMSGYTDDATTRLGGMQPGITFLPKPFTPNGLVEKVIEALSSNPS
jgi:CheY-like chemotaxis protein